MTTEGLMFVDHTIELPDHVSGVGEAEEGGDEALIPGPLNQRRS